MKGTVEWVDGWYVLRIGNYGVDVQSEVGVEVKYSDGRVEMVGEGVYEDIVDMVMVVEEYGYCERTSLLPQQLHEESENL